jgi:eukaryotic-like serine/threonine-protein kinase
MTGGLQLVGGYRIGRRLDRGRANPVYEATDAGGRARLVMRLLRGAGRLDAGLADACRNEIARVARLRHPHIASLLTLDTTRDGVPYLVRELVPGEPLQEYLARRGRLPIGEVVRLLTPVALTLAAVHQLGLIHGELRPSKIFVDGEVGASGVARLRRAEPIAGGSEPFEGSELDRVAFTKLVSFGLWRLHSDRRGPGAQAQLARYSSPELIEGHPSIDGRSDQFALAAIAYRMLAGVDAFPGDDVAAVLQAVLQLAPRPLAASGLCSDDVDAVLRRGLAKRPDDRFESVPAFAAALEAAAAGLPVEITQPVMMGQIEASALMMTPPARPAPELDLPPMHRTPAPSPLPAEHRGPSLLRLLLVIAGLGAGLGWWLAQGAARM